ncbi:MAG: hypothetical protein ACF8R7_00570 [Phycisphaerales bacterium JB039]
MPEEVGQAGSASALEALSALPVGAHLTVGVALLIGLALWLFGRKLAKPAFALVGSLLGAVAGLLLLPALGTPPIADIPSPYLGLGAGAVVGLIIAGFVFRFTMALASAGVVGLAALLISSIYVTANPPSPSETESVATPALASIAPPLTLFQLRLPAVPVAYSIPPGPGGAAPDGQPGQEPAEGEEAETPDSLEAAAENVREFVAVLGSEIQSVWSAQSEEGRIIVLGSTVIGLAVGFLIGLGAPNRAAIVITSMAGCAIWMPSVVVLAHGLELPGRDLLALGPQGWLIAWMAASVIGIGAQLVLARKAPAEEPAAPSGSE